MNLKTEISCNIDNIIRNYCYNFLSYLCLADGWKRTTFDMGKEIYIHSYINSEKKIRIFISNTGRIMINCEYLIDIIEAISFIQNYFEYARMNYICCDDEVIIITKFVTTFELEMESSDYFSNEYGTIKISENIATLTYNKYENLDKLLKYFNKIEDEIVEDEDEEENIDDEDEDEEEIIEDEKIEDNDYFVEGILLSSFIFWMSSKVMQYL